MFWIIISAILGFAGGLGFAWHLIDEAKYWMRWQEKRGDQLQKHCERLAKKLKEKACK